MRPACLARALSTIVNEGLELLRGFGVSRVSGSEAKAFGVSGLRALNSGPLGGLRGIVFRA